MKIVNILKKIAKIFKLLLLSYLLLIFNAFFIGLVYIKVSKSQSMIAFPFGIFALLLSILELFIYFRFIKKPKKN